jgi:hypothetical protein
VVPKKNGKFKICVDFRKLNATTKKDSYPLPFIDEVLNIVVGHDVYSFLNGRSRYHQIFIVQEDKYKTTFVIDWGAFTWVVLPFGVKNGPPTYQKVVSRAFRDYLYKFMKIFLDDFTVYSDMERHLMRFRFCFQKCKKYKINLNSKKYAFMVFSGLIFGFTVSKEGEILDLKKV